MKKVLIAHQSSIPYYRVPFFNALEARRPDHWRFDVAFDPDDHHFFASNVASTSNFKFSTLNVSTQVFHLQGKPIAYQTFWRRAAGYDLLVVENAVNNLTYPLCQLHQLWGKRVAFWGHGRDRNAIQPSAAKRFTESLKMVQVRLSHGFFAYTVGVKQYLIQHGLPEDKIFVVNNTIDILRERDNYQHWIDQREATRQSMGLGGKKVLLFVGRIRKDKRIDYLLEAFAELRRMDASYQLLLVGSGGEEFKAQNPLGVSFLGPLVELHQLGPIYTASDIYVIPAAVGLGPLQAFCYDLPTVTLQAANHGPEFDYLTDQNSIILPADSSSGDFSYAVHDLFSSAHQLETLRSQAWQSIQHLTIDGMADRFIDGVNHILDTKA